MNISLDELTRYSFVISIDEERYNLFQKIFSFHTLPMPKKYEGFSLRGFIPFPKYPEGMPFTKWQNCYMSHIALVKMAKTFDWPFVCVFEDDAYPCYEVKKKLKNSLQYVPDDCDILALGNTRLFLDDVNQSDFHFLKVKQVYGAQAYIVFRNCYDRYMKAANENLSAPEHLWTFLCTYAPLKNLFIQYNIKESMNKYPRYVWFGKTEKEIFREFPRYEYIQYLSKSK